MMPGPTCHYPTCHYPTCPTCHCERSEAMSREGHAHPPGDCFAPLAMTDWPIALTNSPMASKHRDHNTSSRMTWTPSGVPSSANFECLIWYCVSRFRIVPSFAHPDHGGHVGGPFRLTLAHGKTPWLRVLRLERHVVIAPIRLQQVALDRGVVIQQSHATALLHCRQCLGGAGEGNDLQPEFLLPPPCCSRRPGCRTPACLSAVQV